MEKKNSEVTEIRSRTKSGGGRNCGAGESRRLLKLEGNRKYDAVKIPKLQLGSERRKSGAVLVKESKFSD